MSGSAYQERLDARKADFKRGIDGDEARRRRDDTQVSIRKNKREDQLAKRRQQVDGPATPTTATATPGTGSTTKTVMPDMQSMLAKLHGNTFEEVLEATTHFRKILSLEKNPPIQVVIDAGIVPKLVHLCTAEGYPKLQYEAAWALTNIASGSTLQTKAVIDAGAVPIFVRLLMSPDENVREQCIWALGNIAGDSPDHRDMVLRAGALAPLMENVARTSKLSVLRNATWTLSNFTRGKPQPDFALVGPALPCLARLLMGTDEEVLTDACWAISYLSDGAHEKVNAILQCNVMARLVELMGHSNASIQTPALRTIGNIATGDDKQTDAVIAAGALPQLAAMMRSSRKGIRKEAVWTLSNITAGTQKQIEAVRAAGCVPDLVRLLVEAEWEVKKEAAWAVSNYCSGGSREQIRFLVSKKAIKPLCDLLSVSDSKLVLVALDAIKAILKAGQADADSGKFGSSSAGNTFTDMVEDADGLDKIEALQTHSNTKVYERAVAIIETYFSEDQGDEQNAALAPNMQQGAFQFDASSAGFGGSAAGFGNNVGNNGGGFQFGNPGMMQQQQQQPTGGFGFGFGGQQQAPAQFTF